MKKKILFCLVLMSLLVCLLAISASAADMVNYCTVELTLTNGEVVTAYCSTSGNQMQRDNLYKTPDSSGEKYSWEDVVVFDCRNQVLVGSNTPRTFAGVGCNSLAKNVTTVYLSEYFTHFLNSTFTSGWTSLDTVYIPSTVTEIKGFSGSAVKNVVFAKGSQLTTIGGDAFNGCKQLKDINLSECKSLKTIGANAFRSCESLKSVTLNEGLESIGYNGFYLAGLEGTFVVPNSLTVLDAGALLSTKIETLVLGDGALSIGYNFAGTLDRTDNAYLKKVYISAETTVSGSNVFFKCASPVSFYIVGEDCEEAKALLLSNSAALTSRYMTFIESKDATDETGAGYGIIYTGYNRCAAFYGNVHDYELQGEPSSCVIECKRCGEMVSSGGEHSYAITEEFEGGKYISPCVITKSCTVCGNVASTVGLGAIFEWVGYSVPEEPIGGSVGITQCFKVNYVYLADYENSTGKSLQYGLVAANGAQTSPLSLVDGKVQGADGTVKASMREMKFSYFEIKIAGITSANFDTALVFCSYISDGKEIYYVNNGELSKTATGASYNQLKPKN